MDTLITYLSVVVPVFMMVFSRTVGLLFQAPVLGSRNNMPNTVRLALGIMLSVTVMTTLTTFPVLPNKMLAFILVALNEFVLGAIFGFSANLVFLAVQAAGEMAGQQGGLSAATVQNPFTKSGGNAMGTLFNNISLVIFLLIGGHLWMLGGFIQSFQLLPIGQFMFTPALANHFFTMSTIFLSITVQLSLPMVSVVFISEIGVGYMSKVAQQASSLTQDLTTIFKPIASLVLLILVMPNLMSMTFTYTEQMLKDLDTLLRVSQAHKK